METVSKTLVFLQTALLGEVPPRLQDLTSRDIGRVRTIFTAQNKVVTCPEAFKEVFKDYIKPIVIAYSNSL